MPIALPIRLAYQANRLIRKKEIIHMVIKSLQSMHLLCIVLILCLFPTICGASPDLSKATTEDLENQLEKIDTELSTLARLSFRSGAGNIGWISKPCKDPKDREWAEIKLPKNTLIDQIVLVPLVWNDAKNGPQADGFPAAFRIIAGVKGDRKGQVIASMGLDDHLLPRVAPLLIDITPINAAWIRIEATHLSRSSRQERLVFSLSEIMVFKGSRNVALGQPVNVSSSVGGWGALAVYKEALTDGFTPFLMNTGGKISSPHLSFFIPGTRYSLLYGIPYHLIVEGSDNPNFSKAKTLLNYKRNSVYEVGPILTRNVPTNTSRYIRLSIPAPYKTPAGGKFSSALGLAEFEVISNGQNIAKHKKILLSRHPKRMRHIGQAAITDGRNHFGEIIPTRDWMEQLARRHELENMRPLVENELNRKYVHQKANLKLMYWLAAILIVSIAITLLITWMLRLRAVQKTRERIAANLHDELSANLHAVALLGDMAKKNIQTPDKLNEVIDRIQQLSKRSRTAARHCANMIKADTICSNLVKEMKFSAERLLADTEHEITIDGEPFLKQLSKRNRNDLFLFYKECLINIARHAEATSCSTLITGAPKKVKLTVTDNGMGIQDTPPSLKRRANMLRAHIQIETPEGGGSRIILTFRPRVTLSPAPSQ